MDEYIVWIILGSALVVFTIIQAVSGNKKPVQSAVSYIVLGLCTLAAVNVCGLFIPVSLPVTPLSISVAIGGGIPGVTLMLLVRMFF